MCVWVGGTGVCLYFDLSIYVPVCLFVCMSACLSICLSVYPKACMYLYLFITVLVISYRKRLTCVCCVSCLCDYLLFSHLLT